MAKDKKKVKKRKQRDQRGKLGPSFLQLITEDTVYPPGHLERVERVLAQHPGIPPQIAEQMRRLPPPPEVLDSIERGEGFPVPVGMMMDMLRQRIQGGGLADTPSLDGLIPGMELRPPGCNCPVPFPDPEHDARLDGRPPIQALRHRCGHWASYLHPHTRLPITWRQWHALEELPCSECGAGRSVWDVLMLTDCRLPAPKVSCN